jgi:hypothetical protein
MLPPVEEKQLGIRVQLSNGETRYLAGSIGDPEHAGKALDDFMIGRGAIGAEFVETTAGSSDIVARGQMVSIGIAPV